jgi:hypothetical protein
MISSSSSPTRGAYAHRSFYGDIKYGSEVNHGFLNVQNSRKTPGKKEKRNHGRGLEKHSTASN